MRKKFLFVTSLIVILICGCESKTDKTLREVTDLKEQYIKDIDNAKTKEEVLKITQEHNERMEFEMGKLSEEDKKEYEKSHSWEEMKQLRDEQDRLNKGAVDARNRARERFRNNQ